MPVTLEHFANEPIIIAHFTEPVTAATFTEMYDRSESLVALHPPPVYRVSDLSTVRRVSLTDLRGILDVIWARADPAVRSVVIPHSETLRWALPLANLLMRRRGLHITCYRALDEALTAIRAERDAAARAG